MKKNVIDLIKSIITPILLGAIVGLITKNHAYYIKPSITPPDIVFPIAWSIFYGLLGLTHYYTKDNYKANKIYWVQLIINLIWPIIFFKFQTFLLSFLWIILLDINVLIMLLRYKKVSNKSFYLNIPYFLWLIFASILNYATYIVN